MWAAFRSASKLTKDNEKNESQKTVTRSLNLNEEYLNTLRTKSYADFFTKAQSLAAIHSFHHHSLFLLEPCQEATLAALESTILSRNPDVKALMNDYFDISAEASRICSHLLSSIKHIRSNHHESPISIDELSHDQLKSIKSHLDSFSVLNNDHNNPFSNPTSFITIRERYSSVLRGLRTKSKQVARRIKLIGWIKKISALCVTTAFGCVAVAALILAAHVVAALVMGPAVLGFPAAGILKGKKKAGIRFLRCRGALARVWGQLDAAAKGAYTLSRDFDTMSRLVTRLRDEVEHGEGVVDRVIEMRSRDERVVREVVRELRKSDVGLREQVEELEEHVYLCLITINRARALVVKEMMATTSSNSSSSSSSAQ